MCFVSRRRHRRRCCFPFRSVRLLSYAEFNEKNDDGRFKMWIMIQSSDNILALYLALFAILILFENEIRLVCVCVYMFDCLLLGP